MDTIWTPKLFHFRPAMCLELSRIESASEAKSQHLSTNNGYGSLLQVIFIIISLAIIYDSFVVEINFKSYS